MKISNFEYLSEHNEVVLQEFQDTLGEFLIEKTLLIPAKGGKYHFSQKKNRTYSDMPYWIHILNGLMAAFLFIEKDEEMNEAFKSNSDYIRLFIVSFVFHDVNKLCKYDNLGEAVEKELDEMMEDFEVSEFFPDYKSFIQDIKWLILNTEHGTTSSAYGKYHPNLNTRLLDTLKNYLNFADSLSATEIHSTRNLYEHIIQLVQNKSLPNIELNYVDISPNIYLGISTAVYLEIDTLLKKRAIFRLRDGFIYYGEKIQIDASDLAQNIMIEVEEVDLETLAQNEIGGQFHQGINLNFFKRRLFNVDEFIEIVDYFIKAKSGSFLRNYETQELFLSLASQIPGNQFNNDSSQVKIHPDDFDNLAEKDKDLWRMIVISRIIGLNYKDHKEYDSLVAEFNEILQEETYVDLLTKKLKSTSLYIEYALRKKRVGELREKLLSISQLIIQIEENKFKSQQNNEIQRNKQILENFINSYINHNLTLPDSSVYESKKRQSCLICGNYAETELREGLKNTFLVKATNPTNKTLSSLKNTSTPNYICNTCLLDNMILIKNYSQSISKSDSVLFIDTYDYIFNVNHSFIFKTINTYISKKELSTNEKDEESCGSQSISINVSANSMYTINSFFDFNFFQFGNDLETQLYSVYKLLQIIKYTGFKILVSHIYLPYVQHDEMLRIESIKSNLKAFGLDRIRINEIEEKSLVLNFLLQIKDDLSSIYELAKYPLSIFWIIRKNEIKDSNIDKKIKIFTKNFDMSNTKELSKILAEINTLSYDSSSHEESEIIRAVIEILRMIQSNETEISDDFYEKIAGVLYKKYKNKPDIIPKASEFSSIFIDKIYINEWKKQMPNPKELKFWIAQFAYLYKKSSLEIWENRKENKKINN